MKHRGDAGYQRYLANNAQTLEMLVHSYSDALVRFAYSYVGSIAAAEDITADAFAIYLVKKIEFGSKEQLRSWLYKTVRSRAIDYLRRHRRQVSLEELEIILHTPCPSEDLMRKERNEILYRSLQSLRRPYRDVLLLHYIEGFSVQQLCTILGKSSKQVYNLLARAKTALKEILIKEGMTYEDI